MLPPVALGVTLWLLKGIAPDLPQAVKHLSDTLRAFPLGCFPPQNGRRPKGGALGEARGQPLPSLGAIGSNNLEQ